MGLPVPSLPPWPQREQRSWAGAPQTRQPVSSIVYRRPGGRGAKAAVVRNSRGARGRRRAESVRRGLGPRGAGALRVGRRRGCACTGLPSASPSLQLPKLLAGLTPSRIRRTCREIGQLMKFNVNAAVVCIEACSAKSTSFLHSECLETLLRGAARPHSVSRNDR